ncbi:hypothetical protein [Pseudovibrio sp. POLY-S9]|uniref:hypothetical protein n=2 Tax=Pseudovibrio TaxID=258255 RepID=UPI00070E32CB|nr:hypothetical protein [Pseudovibrio sp. POLY-S9]
MAEYKKQKPSMIPLEDEEDGKRAAISHLVEGKASEHQAQVEAMRKADRSRIGFSLVPQPIVDMFKARAAELNMDQKEYFYHLLREDGLKIPTYKELDARNR